MEVTYWACHRQALFPLILQDIGHCNFFPFFFALLANLLSKFSDLKDLIF